MKQLSKVTLFHFSLPQICALDLNNMKNTYFINNKKSDKTLNVHCTGNISIYTYIFFIFIKVNTLLTRLLAFINNSSFSYNNNI